MGLQFHVQDGTPIGLWAGGLSSSTRGPLRGSSLPQRAGSQRGKGRSAVCFVASPGRRHALTSTTFYWSHRPTLSLCGRGLHNGDLGSGITGATWKLAATVCPSHRPLSSALATLTYPGSFPQSPAAEDTQEVTYAQLDQRALTLRAAQAVSPQPTEPTADSSVYAALSRR